MTSEKKTQGEGMLPGPYISIHYHSMEGGEWMGLIDDTNTTTGGKGSSLALVMADSLERFSRMYGYGAEFARWREEVALAVTLLRSGAQAPVLQARVAELEGLLHAAGQHRDAALDREAVLGARVAELERKQAAQGASAPPLPHYVPMPLACHSACPGWQVPSHVHHVLSNTLAAATCAGSHEAVTKPPASANNDNE